MLYPVALNIEGRCVLVIGGGAVAARKVAVLLECGASVTVISPELSADFPQPIHHLARRFQNGDCVGFSLVFAATNNGEVNSLIAQEAKSLGVWCNLADDPQGSNFHTTSVVRRGEITVGISTQGVSPVLARHVRQQVENALGDEYAVLLRLASGFQIPTSKRGEFWRQVLASNVLELLANGKIDEARERMTALLDAVVTA